MDIRKEIKKILLEKDMTMSELVKQIGIAKGDNYTIQNFSTKLKRGSITFNELQMIADILNYEIKLEKK